MANDTIHAGNGSDLIIGDAFILRTSEAILVAGGSTTNFGKDDAWQNEDWIDKWSFDDRGDRAEWNLKVGADTITGDGGADLVWGDNLALVSTTITRGTGLGNPDFERARNEVRDGLDALAKITDTAAWWLTPRDHKGPSYSSGKPIYFDNGDDISGGDGDDIIFGQGGDDTLRGDAGNDWLIGGEGKDKLEDGAGQNKLREGSDSSLALRDAVSSRMIDWNSPFSGFGLKKSPFGGTGLAKGGGQSNITDFDFLD